MAGRDGWNKAYLASLFTCHRKIRKYVPIERRPPNLEAPFSALQSTNNTWCRGWLRKDSVDRIRQRFHPAYWNPKPLHIRKMRIFLAWALPIIRICSDARPSE